MGCLHAAKLKSGVVVFGKPITCPAADFVRCLVRLENHRVSQNSQAPKYIQMALKQSRAQMMERLPSLNMRLVRWRGNMVPIRTISCPKGKGCSSARKLPMLPLLIIITDIPMLNNWMSDGCLITLCVIRFLS